MDKIKQLFKNIFSSKNRNRAVSYLLVLFMYVVLEISMNAGGLSNTIKNLLVPTCAYIVAALALNLLVGYLGDLCLGQAGFMAIGAFFGAIAAAYFGSFIDNDIIVLILSLICGGILSGICGVLIGVPVLKLQGDYLAIVTLAFCQIIKTLLLGDPVQGWPSLACIVLFVSGVQLFFLGVIGTYLSKIFLEVKNRPIYIIKEESK